MSKLNTEAEEAKVVQETYTSVRFITKKKETLVAVLSVPSPIFVYLFIGKHGNIGVYDGYFNQQKCYALNLRSGIGGRHKPSRLGPVIVTDSLLMENSDFYVTSTNNCRLHFVDVSASIHLESYVLTDLPYVPTCLGYSHDTENPESTSYLFWGDVRGCVHLLQFRDPSCSLFEAAQTEETQWFSLSKIIEHANHVKYRVLPERHQEVIRHIAYVQPIDWLITCSSESGSSLVVGNIFVDKDPYVFKVDKGIQCFAYSAKLNVTATGSKDGLVRLWNPSVHYQPMSTLQRHRLPVASVGCDLSDNRVFSISKDAHICMWDIANASLLQEIRLNIQHNSQILVSKNAFQFTTLSFQSLLLAFGNYAVELFYVKPSTQDEQQPLQEVDINDFASMTTSEKWNLADETTNYLVNMGCPYLALKLYPIEEIDISRKVRSKGKRTAIHNK